MPRLRALLAGFALSTGLISIAAPSASAVIPTPANPACASVTVPNIPLSAPTSSIVEPFAVLTATDNHGLWAGVRFDGLHTIQLIAWRAGRLEVLDTFAYVGTSYQPYQSVQVLRVTNSGAIIANVWKTTGAKFIGDSEPFRYQSGHRYSYAHNGSWTSWSASSATADGRVAGVAKTPKGSLVVQWSSTGAATVIATGGNALIDGYGDMIWAPSPQSSSQYRFRTPTGKLGQLLPARTPNPTVWLVAGRWVFGDVGQYPPGFAAVRWDMSAAATSTAVRATERSQALTFPDAGGSTGGFVAESDLGSGVNQQSAYYDPYGDRHDLPFFRQPKDSPSPLVGFATDGTVSYSDTNGRATFSHCPLNYAKHNPRGVIYHGAVVNGQTLITGGSFDSDDVTGHDLVYIFDQTTSVRRLLATVTADQYDPSFSKAYGISGNHRYRYALPAVSGRHVYCAYGRNVGYGNQNTLLGCTTVTA